MESNLIITFIANLFNENHVENSGPEPKLPINYNDPIPNSSYSCSGRQLLGVEMTLFHCTWGTSKDVDDETIGLEVEAFGD